MSSRITDDFKIFAQKHVQAVEKRRLSGRFLG